MITPAFGLTATERVLPRLALDFTTASLDPRVTFTRAGNTATVVNSSGFIAGINADLPRFDYDPVTLVCKGLLIEESRANVLLNSSVNGTSLATQSVTVTAAARTLSFYGTGQIVLSGAHSATVTGTGAYPTRTTLTFTPTAGSLTLTVTGTVQFAQLELGSFATSFIPTAGAAVTRNADVAAMTGTNFSDWFNAAEGTFAITADMLDGTSTAINTFGMAFLDAANSIRLGRRVGGGGQTNFQLLVNEANTAQSFIQVVASFASNTFYTGVGAYKQNSFQAASRAILGTADTLGNVPSGLTAFNIGVGATSTTYLNGHVASVNYWPQRLIDAEVQTFSK